MEQLWKWFHLILFSRFFFLSIVEKHEILTRLILRGVEMVERIKIGKEYIGGELLPILTTGLYRDTLDVLREYIQNAIDAGSQSIEVVIDPDTVSVLDDGRGMTHEEAVNAIRLGITDKDPTIDIGFRGIGIYSAFNLCDTLDIFTKSEKDDLGYVIHFDFSKIRKALLTEQARRNQGLPPSLYLQDLLEDVVYGEKDLNRVVPHRGTMAIMSNLLGETYQHVNNWDHVVSYLQNVVPLPFSSDFKYGPQIEEKFKAEDYRVVPLTLQISRRHSNIYRPYSDSIFTHGGEHAPRFFDIKDAKQKYGFAWICINDARKVLKDRKLRGLLIKKYGFSIATRSYLEPYFARTVFNRRITGEIIIQHPKLIPNAGRNDFESNSTRQAFLSTLSKFIRDISNWANEIQEEDKAKEVLAEVLARLEEINKSLPSIQRDREYLLRLNVELDYLSQQLRIHHKKLKEKEAEQYEKTRKLLKTCQDTVKNALTVEKRSRKRLESTVIKSVQSQALQATERERRHLKDIPSDLLTLLDAYDIIESEGLRKIVAFIDENILRMHLSEEDYRQALASLQEFLEE